MTTILFDSTTFHNRNSAFAAGLAPLAPSPQPRRSDDLSGRVPTMPYTSADLRWLADQVQAERDAEAELAEMCEERARLDAMEAEWLASVEWRERSDMPAGYYS